MPHYSFHVQTSHGEQTGTIYGVDEADARAKLEQAHQADASTESFRRSNKGRRLEFKINDIKLEEIVDEPKANPEP